MCPESETANPAGILLGARRMSEREAAALSVHVLAFLGDSVYSLLVREMLVVTCGGKAGELHRRSVQAVNAASQAAGYRRIQAELTEREAAVYRRARNAHSTHTPKHMSEGDYHCATGVEALFGYLYLSGATLSLCGPEPKKEFVIDLDKLGAWSFTLMPFSDSTERDSLMKVRLPPAGNF